MRCNISLDHRGDIEEHSAHTHGININQLEREVTIKVNDTEVLVLSKATNICELPTERRRQVLISWFEALAATGAISDVEGMDNAKIQRHKSANFPTVLKGAIGTKFFMKVYYQLTLLIKESTDLFLGFTCKWSTFVTPIENALGPMAGVKRLIHFTTSKEYLRGGISLADTFHKCNHVVEETFGKTDTVFKHEDGEERSNKVTKEYSKFMAAFEVVQALPTEYDRVREDLEISIADCVHKSSTYFTTWMAKALENATTKGHSVMYRDKILSALSLNKNPRHNNSTAINVVSEKGIH